VLALGCSGRTDDIGPSPSAQGSAMPMPDAAATVDGDTGDGDTGQEAATDSSVEGDAEDATSDVEAASPGVDALEASPDAGVDAVVDATMTSPTCFPVVASPPLLPALHVPIGSVIQWDSNPPSSGPHYPIWAAYQAYDTPVPRGYYVHDLEHGAIVFTYNCGTAGCPDIVAALQQAADSLPDDPLCTSAGEGIRVRMVITPDPLLDVVVAAAAWGWTYKAACVDLPSLEAFAAAHYGQGPEDFCTNGTTQF
jgi:uncharacterized protein DUF3105